MSYFSSDIENTKLLVMYMLKMLFAKVSADQLITAVTECTDIGYFDAQLAISELEKGGFLATSEGAKGMVYSLTPKGSKTLVLMAKNIPLSIRTACDNYLTENRKRILDLGYFSVYAMRNKAGTYDVVMSAFEGDRTLCSIKMDVPDKETAKKITDTWNRKSGAVYHTLYAILTEEDDK